MKKSKLKMLSNRQKLKSLFKELPMLDYASKNPVSFCFTNSVATWVKSGIPLDEIYEFYKELDLLKEFSSSLLLFYDCDKSFDEFLKEGTTSLDELPLKEACLLCMSFYLDGPIVGSYLTWFDEVLDIPYFYESKSAFDNLEQALIEIGNPGIIRCYFNHYYKLFETKSADIRKISSLKRHSKMDIINFIVQSGDIDLAIDYLNVALTKLTEDELIPLFDMLLIREDNLETPADEERGVNQIKSTILDSFVFADHLDDSVRDTLVSVMIHSYRIPRTIFIKTWLDRVRKSGNERIYDLTKDKIRTLVTDDIFYSLFPEEGPILSYTPNIKE